METTNQQGPYRTPSGYFESSAQRLKAIPAREAAKAPARVRYLWIALAAAASLVLYYTLRPTESPDWSDLQSDQLLSYLSEEPNLLWSAQYELIESELEVPHTESALEEAELQEYLMEQNIDVETLIRETP